MNLAALLFVTVCLSLNTCMRTSISLWFAWYAMLINMHIPLFSVKCLVLLGKVHDANVTYSVICPMYGGGEWFTLAIGLLCTLQVLPWWEVITWLLMEEVTRVEWSPALGSKDLTQSYITNKFCLSLWESFSTSHCPDFLLSKWQVTVN